MQKDYLKNINLTIVSNYLPRFDVGSSNTRIYHIVKLLSNMGIYITYIYFYTSLDDTRYIKSIPEVNTIRLNGSPHEHVQNILASKPDILWLTNLWTPIFFESMSQLMNNVRNRRPEVKIILDTMDLHAKKYHRRYAITRSPDDLFTAKKFLDLEKTNYPNADAVVVVTEDEKNDILGLKLDSPSIYVIPNIHQISTVNTSYDQRGDLVYLGNFNINHNIDAVLHFVKVIFPYVSKKYPKLRLHILGREADTKLSQLAGPTICVHGFVHDLEKALAQFRVFICPMTYGAGMKGKLGEAMANGLPIVATTIGAEGFDLIDGENCFIADFPEEFAQKTIQLYENEILWNNFSTNCRNLIQQNFSYEPVAKLLRELIFSFKPASILLTHEQAGKDFENKPPNKNILTSNSFTTVHKIESYLSSINWLHKLFDYSSHFDYAEIINDNKIPAVSVIIISWRLHPDTTNCLQILKKQRTQPFEIIFVDNGSDLGIFDALKPNIDTYVRLNSNSGAYLARNIGSIFAKSPILFFLDDDAIPADNIIDSHLSCYTKFDVIAVRGVCKPKTNNPLNQQAKHYYLGPKPFPIYADIEGNTSYLASAFFKADGWDDAIRFGGGGVDLSRRLLEIEPDMRKQIYSPDPIIFHDFASDQSHLEMKREKQRQSRARLKKKHPDYNEFIESWKHFRNNEEVLLLKSGASFVRTPNANYRKIKSSKVIENPLISICIPTYNRENFISSAIKSAANQSYKNCEIIVVDDGSTDNTRDIVLSYGIKNLKYIQKEHTSAPDTRNRCIFESSGDFILWLDSDDFISSKIIEEYVNLMDSFSDVDIFYSNHFCIDEKGYVLKQYSHIDWHNKNDEMLRRFMTKNPLPNLGTLVRKSIYSEIGEYDINFLRAHDMEFWSRVALAGKFTCKHVDKYLNYIRFHNNNITGIKNPIKTDFSYEAKITNNILEKTKIENLFNNLNWKNEKLIAFQTAYLKIIDRFIEIYALNDALLTCEKYLINDHSNSSLLKKKKYILELMNDFQSHHAIFSQIMKKTQTRYIDEYFNFVKSMNIQGTEKNHNFELNDSDIITLLTKHAKKYFALKNYNISLYLYLALSHFDPVNSNLLKIISMHYLMLGDPINAMHYISQASTLSPSDKEIADLLFQTKKCITLRSKVAIP